MPSRRSSTPSPANVPKALPRAWTGNSRRENSSIPPTRRRWPEWLAKHPNSFWALSLHARNLIAEQKWEEAKTPLKKLISLYPGSRR